MLSNETACYQNILILSTDIFSPNFEIFYCPDVLDTDFCLDAIISAADDVVTVDITICSWETTKAAVVPGAHHIVKVMDPDGPALVVANNVIAFGFPEDNRFLLPWD